MDRGIRRHRSCATSGLRVGVSAYRGQAHLLLHRCPPRLAMPSGLSRLELLGSARDTARDHMDGRVNCKVRLARAIECGRQLMDPVTLEVVYNSTAQVAHELTIKMMR